MLKENLLQIYARSFRNNWDLPAITDYVGGETITYAELSRRIARIHLFFELYGIKQGDKIALLGKNTTDWVIAYMATLTYGATIVPILSEFNAKDAQHIVNHSDAVILLVSDSIWEHLDHDNFHNLRLAISLDKRNILYESGKENRASDIMARLSGIFSERYPNGYQPESIRYPLMDKNALAEINYTSGTTGFSKGVMLTQNNLCGNVVFGIRSKLHYSGSKCLSFLPLAHAYGAAFDMLVPLAVGTHITMFGKTPTPRLLLKALSDVKPNLILCVPLILEKIYKNKILPILKERKMKALTAIPLLDKLVYARIRRELVTAFGGEFSQVIVGGAPLNPEVEAFLYKIHFPFTVGYGMTECGPLISYTKWVDFIPGSSGRTLPVLMHSKVLSDNPVKTPGEICVKGENVMRGYYKNPDATSAVLDNDGWLHTGDMGVISDDGTIFIKGRNKTMILSANGQNIYPEEIEAKLNNMPYVAESMVVERGHKLVALVYPDYEAMDRARLTNAMMPRIMEQVRKDLNNRLAPYEQIAELQLRAEEFEKTPKRSIKRYLYQ